MKTVPKMIISILSVVFLTSSFALSATVQEAPRMPKEELKAKLGTPEIVLIDVRAVTDWLITKKKIKTAVRENPRQPETWMEKYPKDKTIVLYCA